MLQLLDYMLLSSGTLHEAIDLGVRYSPLIVDELRLELVNVGRRSHFRFQLHSVFNADALRFGEDLIAAIAFRLGRHHTPEGGAPEVRLRQPAPAYAERFHKLFGSEVRFLCDHSEVVFDRDLLFKIQAHADAHVVEALCSRANELLGAKRGPLSLTEQTRLLLAHEPMLFAIDAQKLAAKMGMGARLLQRKLREEGTTLRALIDESRKKAAFATLKNPQVSIKDAAEHLGYSEPSAFHRAFKRWTRKTPADFRACGAS
jgi:AraC-like DNA-binding protein